MLDGTISWFILLKHTATGKPNVIEIQDIRWVIFNGLPLIPISICIELSSQDIKRLMLEALYMYKAT